MAAGGYIEIEKGTTPGAAATDKVRIYPSSVDDLWHEVDEAGTDTVFSGATGPAGPPGPGVPPTVTAHGSMGAAETFDYDSGDQTEHSGTLDANCTFTFTNPAAAGSRSMLVLQIDVDSGGPYTVTLPASVANKTEAEAVLSAVPASTTIIIPFTTIDGGTTWIAILDEGGATPDLDAVIAVSSGQDIADALSGAAAPDAGNVFATMADLPSGGSGGTTVLLDYNQASVGDIAALAVTAATWTDLISNQNFTVASGTSIVEIAVRGFCFFNDASFASGQTASRAIIDSGGTPITEMVGGGTGAAVGDRINPLTGCGSVFLSGLSAAVHTIKLQGYCQGTNSGFYCRAAGSPPEFLRIQVIEHLN